MLGPSAHGKKNPVSARGPAAIRARRSTISLLPRRSVADGDSSGGAGEARVLDHGEDQGLEGGDVEVILGDVLVAAEDIEECGEVEVREAAEAGAQRLLRALEPGRLTKRVAVRLKDQLHGFGVAEEEVPVVDRVREVFLRALVVDEQGDIDAAPALLAGDLHAVDAFDDLAQARLIGDLREERDDAV